MKIGLCLPHETDAMGGDTASGAQVTLGLNVTLRICPPGGTPVSEDIKPLSGPPARVAEQLLEFEALGVEHVTAWPEPNTSESLEFLGEVLQALR